MVSCLAWDYKWSVYFIDFFVFMYIYFTDEENINVCTHMHASILKHFYFINAVVPANTDTLTSII